MKHVKTNWVKQKRTIKEHQYQTSCTPCSWVTEWWDRQEMITSSQYNFISIATCSTNEVQYLNGLKQSWLPKRDSEFTDPFGFLQESLFSAVDDPAWSTSIVALFSLFLAADSGIRTTLLRSFGSHICHDSMLPIEATWKCLVTLFQTFFNDNGKRARCSHPYLADYSWQAHFFHKFTSHAPEFMSSK